jgi:hypothetical protein
MNILTLLVIHKMMIYSLYRHFSVIVFYPLERSQYNCQVVGYTAPWDAVVLPRVALRGKGAAGVNGGGPLRARFLLIYD